MPICTDCGTELSLRNPYVNYNTGFKRPASWYCPKCKKVIA